MATKAAPSTAWKGGRPKLKANLQELCRNLTDRSVEALTQYTALTVPKERVRAAEILLAYGYGRPLQTQNLRVIRGIEDLSDEELAALAGIEENPHGTRH